MHKLFSFYTEVLPLHSTLQQSRSSHHSWNSRNFTCSGGGIWLQFRSGFGQRSGKFHLPVGVRSSQFPSPNLLWLCDCRHDRVGHSAARPAKSGGSIETSTTRPPVPYPPRFTRRMERHGTGRETTEAVSVGNWTADLPWGAWCSRFGSRGIGPGGASCSFCYSK